MSRSLTVGMANSGPLPCPRVQLLWAGGQQGGEGLSAWMEVKGHPGFSMVPSTPPPAPQGRSQTESRIPLPMWLWIRVSC